MNNPDGADLNAKEAPRIASLGTPVWSCAIHKSHVLSCEFDSSGRIIASGSHNGQIYICTVNEQFSQLIEAHSGPVMEIHFSADNTKIYSCSQDKTVAIWDYGLGTRIMKFKGHSNGVNCVQAARICCPVLCSGSKDGTIRIWDIREQECARTLENRGEVTTAVCFNKNGEYVFSGGLDKDIKIWDLRTSKIVCKLLGHTGCVTGLALSPCGSYLLSHSIDNTLRIWDVRPYFSSNRCVGVFPTKQRFVGGLMRCGWSSDGKMISAGTSDSIAYIWDSATGEELFQLKFHDSCINDIAFHPKKNILLTASNDNNLFLHKFNK